MIGMIGILYCSRYTSALVEQVTQDEIHEMHAPNFKGHVFQSLPKSRRLADWAHQAKSNTHRQNTMHAPRFQGRILLRLPKRSMHADWAHQAHNTSQS